MLDGDEEAASIWAEMINEGDDAYLPMAKDFDASIGFQAAKELILEGTAQPSGYTEPILHRARLEFKKRHGIDQG